MITRDDRWCDWVNPTNGEHRMACCDCNLVHNMQFRVVLKHTPLPNGYYHFEPIEGSQFAVQFRAQRNNRSTANRRRAKK